MKKLTSPFLLIKKSWAIFSDKRNIPDLLKIYSPAAIMSLFSLLFVYIAPIYSFMQTNNGSVFMLVFNTLFVLIMVFTNLSGIIATTRLVDGKKLEIKEIFGEALRKYWIFILFEIIISLIYGVSLILLILPIILTVTWFNFSKFILIEEKRGISGIKFAFSESKKLVKGRFWQVIIRLVVFELLTLIFEMVISVLPYGLGMIIFRVCGAFFLLPQVFLYKELLKKNEAPAV